MSNNVSMSMDYISQRKYNSTMNKQPLVQKRTVDRSMFLNNRQTVLPSALAAPKPATQNTSLTGPMVLRVHNVKPGCSACGK
jgi:hypothetical protein